MAKLLKDIAYDKLRTMIAQGRFRYGEMYSLNAIAEEMQMSRTPIRDAIQKLSDERRIDIKASRGFCLHMLSMEELEFHRHFSNAIECYCVALLAQAYTKDNKNPYVLKLKHLLLDMEIYLDEESSFAEYFETDQKFHATIIDSVDNVFFSELKYSSNGFFDRPEIQLTAKKISRKTIYDCHKAILDAICSGDTSEASEAMKKHSTIMMEAF